MALGRARRSTNDITDPLAGLVKLADGSLVVPEKSATRHGRATGAANVDSADVRTESERDRGRLSYSPYLRRLAGVTQVVSPDLNAARMHTRSSHTHKVALVAREIADAITRRAATDTTAADTIRAAGGLDVAACEAAGLAHDLGHPPFGHAGEERLNARLRRVGVRDGFEGNAQSFRIVTRLDRNKPTRINGLDLTNVTLAAISKYPWTRRKDDSDDDDVMQKFGAYSTEAEELKRSRRAIMAGSAARGIRQTLEASVMDLADDLAYAVHDLEDFFAAGAINPISARTDVEDAIDSVTAQAGDWGDADQSNAFVAEAANLRKRYAGYFDDDAYLGAVQETRYFLDQYLAIADTSTMSITDIREVLGDVIGDLFPSITIDKVGPYVDGPLVYLRTPEWHRVQCLKLITKKYLVFTPRMGYIQRAQSKVIDDLFTGLESWLSSGAAIGELPESLAEMLAHGNASRVKGGVLNEEHYRAISDYICSLSDTEALQKAQWLRGAEVPGMSSLLGIG